MTPYRLSLPVVLACGLAGCAAPQASESPAPRPVRVAEARMPETPRGVRYAATIQPAEQVTLAVKAAGYIAAIPQVRGVDGQLRTLQPGDPVKAGAILVQISESDYRERVRQAEAALREVEASLTKARRDFERAQTLFDAESLTLPDLDAARAAHDGAAARRASAEAQLAAANLALADCRLIAPFDGVVLERRVEIGMLATAGTPAFVIGRVANVEATFGVPDGVVSRLTPGEPLSLTTEAFPRESFAGRVTALAPSADPQSRVFTIEITVPNHDGRLRPGMIGTIEVGQPAGADPTGVAVPLSAVVRSPGGGSGYSVFVIDSRAGSDVARVRSVALGETAGNLVVVTKGLERGDRVIEMGATLVTDGDAVRVIP